MQLQPSQFLNLLADSADVVHPFADAFEGTIAAIKSGVTLDVMSGTQACIEALKPLAPDIDALKGQLAKGGAWTSAVEAQHAQKAMVKLQGKLEEKGLFRRPNAPAPVDPATGQPTTTAPAFDGHRLINLFNLVKNNWGLIQTIAGLFGATLPAMPA